VATGAHNFREVQLGHGRGAFRFGLPNQGTLKFDPCIDIDALSLNSFDIGHGLRKPRAAVSIVLLPIRRPRDFAKFEDGLRKAGLPE
jgi:hypothetical protein